MFVYEKNKDMSRKKSLKVSDNLNFHVNFFILIQCIPQESWLEDVC